MSHPQQPQFKADEEPQIIPQKKINTGMTINSSTLFPPQVPILLSKLEALLPYSIPLLRRIQFHLHHPLSESARIYVAVAADAERGKGSGTGNGKVEGEEVVASDPGSVERWLRSSSSSDGRGQDEKTSAEGGKETAADSPPWIAAHIDLANPGQCQVWMFASWEADGRYPFPSSVAATSTTSASASASASASTSQTPSPSSPSTATTTSSSSPVHSSSTRAVHDALVRSLFEYIHTDLVPHMPSSPPDSWLELQRTGKYLSTPYLRNKVLFGTISEKLWGHFPVEARTRTDDGYWKYLFRVAEEAPSSSSSSSSSSTILPRNQPGDKTNNAEILASLPSPSPSPPLEQQLPPIIPSAPSTLGISPLSPEYHFGPMRPSHLQTVLDRTPIPRTLATLRQYVSLGLFHRSQPDRPVGWGFLGKDASLSSLHTEPEHRGKGLAVALGRELLRRQHVVVSPSAASVAATMEEEAETDVQREGDLHGASKAGEGYGSQHEREQEVMLKNTTTDSPNIKAATTTTATASSNTDRYTWAHADVSKSNTASRRVMEKLGGTPLWMVMWTEVDIEKLVSCLSLSS